MSEKDKKLTLSDEEKSMLINTINKRGFFLEEKAYGILEQRNGVFHLRKNFIPEKYNDKFEDRVEIDLVFEQDDKDLIIECKKTDFAWIFPKSLVGSNNVNYIYEIENKISIRSFEEDRWRACYSEPMAIMMNSDGNLIPQNNEKEFVKTPTRQEDPIHRAVQRVLVQTKAWRWNKTTLRPYSFYVPIILTNARLFFMDYNSEHIDKDSNLVDYNSLEEVGTLIYNYPEFLGLPNSDDERTIKSVFVVNINHFSEFLDWFLPQFMGDLNQRKSKKQKETNSYL